MRIFPEITVSGAPRERGRSLGQQTAHLIRITLATYSKSFSEIGFTNSDLRRFLEPFDEIVRSWAPEMVEEIEGIAEGSGLSYHDILFLNSRSEVLQFARRERAALKVEPDGCTAGIILPEASTDGRTWHGQNLDWRVESLDSYIVLKICRKDGPNIVMLAEAGVIGRIGVNSAGLALTGLHLECDRDYRGHGVPVPFIRRRALDSTHYSTAILAIASTSKAGSNCMMLSTEEGDAIAFECAPDETFPIYADKGVLVHSNHWLSHVAQVKLRDTSFGTIPDSLYRARRIQSLLDGARGKLNANALKEAFADRFGYPHSICRPHIETQGQNLSATVASVVMCPQTRSFEVAADPSSGANYICHTAA